MWLPTPVYERIPQFWFLLGLLFIAIGFYLGVNLVVSLIYIAIGILCSTFGVGVRFIRRRHRKNKSASSDPQNSA